MRRCKRSDRLTTEEAMTMGTKCFMLEECNERREPYGPPEEGHYHRIFDVRRVDTGEVLQRDTYYIGPVPVGAMWWEEFVSDYFPTGPGDYHPKASEKTRAKPAEPSMLFCSGPVLCVRTPGGVWRIDTRASNCGLPYDYEHRCWVRHGEPPNVHVDKNGLTCNAGAGSIQCGDYHGFLHNGELT
jgi:hypothetical protein